MKFEDVIICHPWTDGQRVEWLLMYDFAPNYQDALRESGGKLPVEIAVRYIDTFTGKVARYELQGRALVRSTLEYLDVCSDVVKKHGETLAQTIGMSMLFDSLPEGHVKQIVGLVRDGIAQLSPEEEKKVKDLLSSISNY